MGRGAARGGLSVALALALCPLGAGVAFADPSDAASADASWLADAIEQQVYEEEARTVEAGDMSFKLSIANNLGVTPLSNALLPSSYVAPLTNVKDQGRLGACWSFGAMTAIESSRLVLNGAAGSEDVESALAAAASSTAPDYSEAQLVYFTYNPDVDETGAVDPASDYYFAGPSDVSGGFDSGGNWYKVAATLGTWQGVASEQEAPYVLVSGLQDPSDPGAEAALKEEKIQAGETMAASAKAANGSSLYHAESVEVLPELSPIVGASALGSGSYHFDREVSTAARDSVKQTINDTGAISIGYYAETGTTSPYYHQSISSVTGTEEEGYRVTVDERASRMNPLKNYWVFDADNVDGGEASRIMNHGVALVGWDDSYSRFNFMTPLLDDEGNERAYDEDIVEVVNVAVDADDPVAGTAKYLVPKEDGSWIMKNSWGLMKSSGDKTLNMGEDGFFRLSYAEKTFMQPYKVALEDAAAGEHQYDISHQYDGVQATPLDSSAETMSAANVFTASQDELVQAIGTWSAAVGTKAHVVIYTNLADKADPASGTPAVSFDKTFDAEGYFTVELPQDVAVSEGTSFSVVVSMEQTTSEDYERYYVPLEMSPASKCALFVDEGQSFVKRDDGAWTDLSAADELLQGRGMECGNVAVKAFAVSDEGADPEPDPVPPAVDPDPSPTPPTPPAAVVPEKVDMKDAAKSAALVKTGDDNAATVVATFALAVGAAAALTVAVVALRRRRR